MILVIPNYVFSRVGAALLDAVLDVGYMVTSIWLYVVFATNYLTDIFLSSFLNYMSIYICVAHVLCVCRSLETADWIALFQVRVLPPPAKPGREFFSPQHTWLLFLVCLGALSLVPSRVMMGCVPLANVQLSPQHRFYSGAA